MLGRVHSAAKARELTSTCGDLRDQEAYFRQAVKYCKALCPVEATALGKDEASLIKGVTR